MSNETPSSIIYALNFVTLQLNRFNHFFLSLQAVGASLEERGAILAHLEADCEALSKFVTPGEVERIRTRLANMGQYWEELRARVEQLGGQLPHSASHRTTCSDNLEQVTCNIIRLGCRERYRYWYRLEHCDT